MQKFNNHSQLPFKWIGGGDSVNAKDCDTGKIITRYAAEDDCIIDSEGVEVLGCSEWIRIQDDNKEFIIEACNSYYQMKEEIENLKQKIKETENKGGK